MSGLELPGQVGIGVLHVPGNNATAVATTLQAGPNQIQICVAGGLTKRQELAARFLAALLVDATFTDLKSAIIDATEAADALLAATEPVESA